ncbi:MAG: EamA family transporter [Candidatus Levyibacteriota bacterium]
MFNRFTLSKGVVFALAPLYVTVLSYLFLGERLSLIELAGGLLIVGSVFFVERLKI